MLVITGSGEPEAITIGNTITIGDEAAGNENVNGHSRKFNAWTWHNGVVSETKHNPVGAPAVKTDKIVSESINGKEETLLKSIKIHAL